MNTARNRTESLTLLQEVLTFGTPEQKRGLRAFLRTWNATQADLLEDTLKQSDETLSLAVDQIGYGV